jgi:hypothetical protein
MAHLVPPVNAYFCQFFGVMIALAPVSLRNFIIFASIKAYSLC